MKRAIKTHFQDFLAILGVIIVALAVLLFILSNQKAAIPSWVPGLGQDFYSINAQFPTAQAITPGQGQSAVIAGINVGKVGAATLEDGTATIRLDLEPEYVDILHEDAEFLIRPKTGLNDMTVQIDPGTAGPPPEEGSTLPLSQGLSNVQLDQFWASLDADTQDYLVLLLNGAGEGLNKKGPELSQTFRRFGPFSKYTAKLNGVLAKRRENIRQGIHAFSQIATELGNNDQVVADFITQSNESLGNFAAEEAALREALQEFPSTLTAAQRGFVKSDRLSRVLRPTLLGLIPGAKKLKSSLRAVQDLSTSTTDTVRDDIRPFTRNVQPVFRSLARTSEDLTITGNQSVGIFKELNRLFDLLAYNPPGDTQEGFLFWAPWMNHNLNSTLDAQDGQGPIRRGLALVTCNTAQQAAFVGLRVPQLITAYQLAQLPSPAAICPPSPIPPIP